MTSKSTQVLAQCATLFQLTGFQYFSIEKLQKEKERKFPTIFYNLFFTVVFLASPIGLLTLILMLSDEKEEVLSVKTIFSQFIQNLMGLGFVTVSITGLGISYFKTNRMKRFFMKMDDYCKISSQTFLMEMDYRKLRTHVYGNFLGTIIFFFGVQILKKYFILGDDMNTKIFYCILFPFFVCAMTTQALLYYVTIVNEHLEHLNLIFNELLHPFEDKISMYGVQKIKNVESKLSAAKKLYNVIKESSEIVNIHYGFLFLSIFIFQSLACVSAFFNVFVSVLGKKSNKSEIIFDNLVVAFWSIIELYRITFCCHKTSKLVVEIMRTLERYFARIDGGHGENNDRSLTKFYLQLSFSPVKFSVAGFYDISLNLFASVMKIL